MTPLEAQIRKEIAAGSIVSVHDYMARALSEYYGCRDPLGALGDFTTAPEISPLFGEIVGLWLVSQWLEMGAPPYVNLIELGPGRGTLMRDILHAARVRPIFLEAAEVHLVETSVALRKHQQEALEGYNVHWHGGIDEIPSDAPWLVVANEFFDALPIRQYVGERERYLALKKEGALTILPEAQQMQVREICPAAQDVMNTLCRRVKAQGGAALIIDYSTKRDAWGDTLQAIKAHQPCGIFETPGQADLTAHVDFSALEHIAKAHGLKPCRQGQGSFLIENGILHRLQALNSMQQQKLESGVTRLIAPEHMGRLFLVLFLLAWM